MVSGCNIQISLCCSMASLRVWITDCNRRPVLLGWKSLQVLPSAEGRFRILIHSQFMSHSLYCLLLYGVTVPVHNGQKTFHQISLGLSVFSLCLPRTLRARGTEKDDSCFSSSHWCGVFQRPLKEGNVLWWEEQIHQASGEGHRSVTSLFWHPFKISKWNTTFWEGIAIGMLMFSQRFGKLVR